MTHNEQALLRLVRLSLAADAVREDALLPTGIDWPALLAMAWRQGVSALVLDGLERLPESQRPPKPLLLQWIGRVAMMEQLYAKHEQCIASLADFTPVTAYVCFCSKGLVAVGVGPVRSIGPWAMWMCICLDKRKKQINWWSRI